MRVRRAIVRGSALLGGPFTTRLTRVLDQAFCGAVGTMDRGFRSIEMLAVKNQIIIATWAMNVT